LFPINDFLVCLLFLDQWFYCITSGCCWRSQRGHTGIIRSWGFSSRWKCCKL